MKKIVFACLSMVFVLGACDRTKTVVSEESSGNDSIQISNLSSTLRTNAKAKSELEKWGEYTAFSTSFEAVYTINTEEDLTLVIDDLIDKIDLWEDSEYPEAFDIPQIRSRQKVLNTYLLRLKAAQDNGEDIETALTAVVNAYNAIQNQFNITVNSTLDTKLIFDE